MRRVVIIGNGITGVTAAMEIRRLKPTWKITMISGESPAFFSRPALMYVYMGHMRLEQTRPYPERLWDQLRIERVHDRVTEVDTRNGRVRTTLDGWIGYDQLLLATGSKPNRFGWPGQDLDRVQGFYGLEDLAALEEATPGLRTAVIVGGGLIGVELAECLHTRGARVIVLARESSYWNTVLPAGESRMVSDVIRASGIDLRLDEELASIEGDARGRARAVTTRSGERIECGLVGLTAGVSPDLSALAGAEIETGRGVLVDDRLRASVENVFAAGDCAEIRGEAGRGGRIEQLWYTGQMQGEVVGRNIAGGDARYDRGVWFNSAKFVDLEWQTYGRVPGEVADPEPPPSRSLYWEHADRRHALRVAHEDGVVVGMNALGLRHRHRVWERWISEGRSVEHVLEHLGEANFDPELYARHEEAIVGSLAEQLR